MKISKEAIQRGVKNSLNVVFIAAGLGAIGYGAWQVYEPAAFVLVGGIVFWMGLPDR
ncbi:MAG TPA: hypothetical protein VK971_07640 [Thiohalobacter sp.]|nr:hypothetical protein [Thiohalobacter sp.]